MTRYTAKGKLIQSNYSVEPVGPSTYRCRGCGREFNTYAMRGPYSRAVDGVRWDNLNHARATRHADTCKGREN